jgi:SAM-dependent methyltransferase
VRALEGTAEAIPLPDASVDASVVAQAFHWFDGDAALSELHRVLRPGGRLSVLWNVRDDERAGWVAELTRIMEPFRGEAPSHRSGRWREAFERSDLFGPLELRSFRNDVRMTPDAIVERVMSVSFIAALPDVGCRGVRETVRHLLDHHPDLAGRDEIVFPYRTDVYVCRRR